MNLHHLRLFRAIARDGTLTGAARTLNLSQSAVSTQLRTLEATLGHDLFDRRGRGLVLTEAGRIALDHAEAIFRTADDLTATLAQSGTARRVLRVGALSTLSRNFLIGFVAPLIGRQDVELVLRSGAQADLIRGLEALSLDIVLTNLAPARDAASPYLVQALTEQPISVVGFPRDAAEPPSLADLLTSEPLILPTPESALARGLRHSDRTARHRAAYRSRSRRYGDAAPAGPGRRGPRRAAADRGAGRNALGPDWSNAPNWTG